MVFYWLLVGWLLVTGCWRWFSTGYWLAFYWLLVGWPAKSQVELRFLLVTGWPACRLSTLTLLNNSRVRFVFGVRSLENQSQIDIRTATARPPKNRSEPKPSRSQFDPSRSRTGAEPSRAEAEQKPSRAEPKPSRSRAGTKPSRAETL